ncbi:MAG TPA: 30S ribosomal protein S14 [Alphaproteobacteria bacterium]|nr:30S ribosomal protein S14 [Alphaproteobacteria bacterium]
MAKTCSVERNDKRKVLVKKFAARRAKLKATIMDKSTSPEDRFEAVLKLTRMPKNSAKIRIRNRCEITGRPRGVYRKFGLCRIKLRELASIGQLPGLIKSSW